MVNADDPDNGPQILATNFDSKIQGFAWCGDTDENIIVHTGRNKVYRGSNKGSIYKHILNSGNMTPEIIDVFKNDYYPSLIFLVGSKGEIWGSKNCGDSVTLLNNNFKITEMEFNPSDENWMLGQDSNSLYLTKDFGMKWEIIATNIVTAKWLLDSEKNKATIYALTTDKEVLKTNDFFKNSTRIADNVENIIVNNGYLILSKKNELLVSNSYEGFYRLYSSQFQNGSYFHIVDTANNKIFVLVNPFPSSPFGDLYDSDSFEQTFIL